MLDSLFKGVVVGPAFLSTDEIELCLASDGQRGRQSKPEHGDCDEHFDKGERAVAHQS